MENKEWFLPIHLGALADPLEKQILAHRFKFNKTDIALFQRVSESITTLYLSNMINDSANLKLKVKLSNRIIASVAKSNKLKVADYKP